MSEELLTSTQFKLSDKSNRQDKNATLLLKRMAFGFPPNYQLELPLEDLTPQQFLVLIIEATKQLDWDIRHNSENGFICYSKFSMSSWSEEISVAIEGDHAILKSACTGSQLFDWGKNKRNIQSLVNTFNELKGTSTLEEIDKKYELLKPSLIPKEEDILNSAPTATTGKIKSVFAIFTPTQGYFITPIIININIAIFILMVISGVDFMSPDTQSLIKWGANFRPVTLQGEWWRLLSNCFLHIGLFHLLFNMYALLYVGLLLEPYLGRLRYLTAYLLTGIVASTASLWFHDQTVSAGASGAIFGLYGVFLAMLTTNFIDKSVRKALFSSIAIFVVYNLMNGMKDGIDNAAHIGGLVSGFIIGYLYYPSLKSNDRMDLKLGTVGGLSLIMLVICFVICTRIPNYIGQYDTKMKSFTSMENMALEIYRMPKNAPKDSILNEIKNRGIYYWKENMVLINGLDTLKLPDNLHKQDKMLLNYCNLRIKSYNLIYKAVSENTDKYKDSITLYNKSIEAVIDSLKGK